MRSSRRSSLLIRRHATAWLTGALAAVAVLVGVAPAQAASKAPKLTKLRCVPATLAACKRTPTVSVGDLLQVRGSRLARAQPVTFRSTKGTKRAKLAKSRSLGWTVRVPSGLKAGTVRVSVTGKAGRRSNQLKIKVVAKVVSPPRVVPAPAPAAPAPAPPAAPAPAPPAAPALIPIPAPVVRQLPAVFASAGGWIWFVKDAEGGNLDAIAARAKAAGFSTLFIKAADGKDADPQFTAELVAGLHARGLQVCGWQVVYGGDPAAEAAAAVASKATGEDCLVINAEDQYAGRGAQARQYVAAMRAGVGAAFPVGFTSHPYVDAHTAVPYSAFLASGGAQANLPQVYWKDIGDTVDVASGRTLKTNRIYGVPLAPIGQQWDEPAATDLRRFRALWAGYGAAGMSWWRAELSTQATWTILDEPAPAPVVVPDPGWPALAPGASGDMVLRLQQLLAASGSMVTLDGQFGPATQAAVKAYQAARGLSVSGATDAVTWQALIG